MQTGTQRRDLNQERVVAAALSLADSGGIEEIQMRKVAASLSVTAMAIYNHVDNKDELIDLMLESVAAEITRPTLAGNWRQQLRDLAVATRDMFRRHPWAVDQWTIRPLGHERWALMETVLELLAQASLPDDLADLAFHAIVNHIFGCTRQEIAPNGPEVSDSDLDAFSERDRYPRIGEHIEYHRTYRTDHDPFLYVLDTIIDDLSRRAGESSSRKA